MSAVRESAASYAGPDAWRPVRLKFELSMNASSSEISHLPPDTVVTFLPMEAIGVSGELDVSRTRKLDDVRAGYTYLADGDIALAKITPCFENGKCAIAAPLMNSVAFATTEVLPLRPRDGADVRFFYYLLVSEPFRSEAEASMYGAGGQKRVPDSAVANHVASMPTSDVRRAIARFLDSETARIDTLIDKQKKLIKLLKEKRQGVISQAVTKGLDPDVPMRGSGVEWLGEVPAHWVVVKLHWRYSVELGKMADASKQTGKFPVSYLRNRDVRWSGINTDDLPVMDIDPTERERYLLRDGDMLACEGRDLGRAAIWRSIDVPVAYQKALHRLRVRSCRHDEADYLYFAFMLANALNAFESDDPSTTIPHLPAEDLRQMRFCFPPLAEQVKITEFLSERLARFDRGLEHVQQAMDLLQERRTALITAAVTGQIDVTSYTSATEPAAA